MFIDYLSLDQPYAPRLETVSRNADPEAFKKAGHDNAFKPAKTVPDKADYKASYEHLCDRVDVKKVFRDEEGNVITGPKNFYTTPGKKGKAGKNITFTPQPQHMPDEYDFAKDIAKKEAKEGKIHEQEKPFS